ncbi:MAG: hypothetical protein ACRCWI_02660 [Brevinema sp.]
MIKNIFLFFSIFFFSTVVFSQEITTANVTNLNYITIPQYELPKRYLIDSYSTLYPKENLFRRADIVFFLSIPITMFIMQNVINFINIFNIALDNYNSDLGRDNFGFTLGEWSYIISALIMIPLGVMIYDTVYVQQYPITPFFKQDTIKEIRVTFNVYRIKF